MSKTFNDYGLQTMYLKKLPSLEEAWWMMMVRMQAWNMSIKLVMREGLTVPHYYYGDPSRVYIL
jgi:hypothetical protein